jgi:hypothetical protein
MSFLRSFRFLYLLYNTLCEQVVLNFFYTICITRHTEQFYQWRVSLVACGKSRFFLDLS